MKKHKILLINCGFLLAFSGNSFAQTGPVTAGGDGTGTGGSFSYSIGQVDYVTATGTGGTGFEGLQQPFEIFSTGINKEPGIELSAVVYPNPTDNGVMLSISNRDVTDMSYSLCDMLGKVIVEEKINSLKTNIALSQLSSATYLLTVKKNNQELQSFKIIKTK